MLLQDIRDFQRFTSFDLNRIGDPSLHQDLTDPISLIHLYEVKNKVSTGHSFELLKLEDALSIFFNVYENEYLCAVIVFNDEYKIVHLEKLPDGAYHLLLNCTNRILGHYIDNKLLSSQNANLFRFNVMLNFLENRFMLNTHCNASTAVIHNQIERYFDLWLKAPLEG